MDSQRGDEHVCLLCLQVPAAGQLDKESLIAEQDRLASQVDETADLIDGRGLDLQQLRRELSTVIEDAHRIANELDYRTRTYVSEQAAVISGIAASRAAKLSQVRQFEDYLGLFDRLDRALGDIELLQRRRSQLEAQLSDAEVRTESSEYRISYLEREFGELVERLKIPRLEGPDEVRIDRQTYLPIIYGRRFTELSSQGLKVLVNVAHALAHHRTSLALNLGLPQILFIDGLTSNLGHEGEDRARVNAVYEYLIQLSNDMGDRLQVIVADNDVPSAAERYIRLQLSEDDRLIRRAGTST